MARILVAGGSLGGLLAANLLLRDGHDVLVLEKVSDSLDGRGAGLVAHSVLIDGLRRAGASVDQCLGVTVAARVTLDPDGRVVSKIDMPQTLTSWSRLYQLLRQALPGKHYLQGVTVCSVVQDGDGIVAHCDGDRRFTGDMLVASDGLHSVVRAQYAPTVQPVYAGYVGWRGVCDEAVLSRFTLDSVFDCFGFGLPAGEQLIGYPVAGADNSIAPGKRRYNFVWYRAAGEQDGLAELLTDADGTRYAHGIPPNKVSWRHIAAMRQAARTLLAPQFAEILEKAAQPFLQPIFDASSRQIAFGRVVLMGDAAFVARPHVGIGVTKAAEDALALTDCIAREGAGAAAADAYQTLRLAAGQSAVRQGRDLGAYMKLESPRQRVAEPASDRAARAAAIRRDAEAVMRRIAIDPALAASC